MIESRRQEQKQERSCLHLCADQSDPPEHCSLDDIFNLDHLQSALVIPVEDVATGEILGLFTLFHMSGDVLSDENRTIAQDAAKLASRALYRAMALERSLAMASSDELTGLLNRRGYYGRFDAELERARRQQTPLCVALIDVDHFKRLNDAYGHINGDRMLQALAKLLMENVRRSDVVCRFGGEEFAVLLPDTAINAAAELMERIRDRVAQMEVPGMSGEPMRVTVSAGLAQVNPHDQGKAYRAVISEALADADKQLYLAKAQGRNQIRYTRPEIRSGITPTPLI